MKCSRKDYFTKNCKGGQQNYTVKGTSILKNNNRVKATRACLIKYFTFYYNTACKVYKDTKYGIG